MNWIKVLNEPIPLEVMTNSLPTKGNLVYEYNPFRNYRLSKNKYYYKDNYYSLKEILQQHGLYLYYIDEYQNIIEWSETMYDITPSGWAKYNKDKQLEICNESPELYEKGLLIDFITDELKFSLEHPVHIVPQYSYDGSVNLIINDGLNTPRLINSRFSATGRNTYEIVDRKGNNDTNIYDEGDLFDIDTSLYKRVVKIPKIDFKGTSFGGNLKIGNYHFYFKLADSDGNETDFVGESGLVSIFIGFNNPDSIHSGSKNENSFKLVEFQISNIDTSYDNIYVYYSRYTAEGGENFITEYKKINKKFIVNSFGIANLSITGYEDTIDIAATDINLMYNTVDSANTTTVCLNMLFMGNVHKPDIPYNELLDLSLRFLPYLEEENYPLIIDQEYFILSHNKGYYDSKFIYDKTGYWPNEIYRFGVVYILPNNELSPVFNIRGGCGIRPYLGKLENSIDESYDGQFSNVPIFNSEGERIYINYNEENFNILLDDNYIISSAISIENIKGVCKFEETSDKNTIYGINIRASKELIDELKKYVKGYFFVRQSRIPTILALGITIGIDKESGLPCLPTVGGVINDIDLTNLDKTYIETKNLDGVNYISEGFLTRYSFSLKPKGGFFKFLSGLLQAFAAVCSFIPGIGTIGSLIINAASFAITSIVSGKFNTAAFFSTVVAGSVAGLSLVSKALTALKSVETASKVSKTMKNIVNTLNKVINLLGNLNKVEKILDVTNTGAKIINGIQGTTDITIGTVRMLLSEFTKREYNGRNTEVPSGFKKVENDDSRIVGGEFSKRIIIKSPEKVKVSGIICPDYIVDQPRYNQIFTGNEHTIRYSKCQGINYKNQQLYNSNYFTSNFRHFYHPEYFDLNVDKQIKTKIIGIPDNVKAVGLDSYIYRSRAGEAEESWHYLSIGKSYKSSEEQIENTDIVRGVFSAYLATNTEDLDAATIVDIMIPEYSESYMNEYFYIRMIDSSQFQAISPRYDINDLKEQLISYTDNALKIIEDKGYLYHLYRGDCYICQFTQRIIRNFNDPSAPYNDKIVDQNTWKDNYDPDNTEKYELINLGDVNAVELGMWLTFRLRSSNNLNIRTLDGSNVDDTAMTGHSRGYYPYYPMSTEGSYKHPDSLIYNKGFTKSISERWNFELPDVPHIKNWFGTRIMYSDIHINDAYKNGFRVFRGTNYRDYTREYGEIVKLISLESNLLCIFEHGIALIPVNERAIAGQGAGGNVYINTSNVLPENPKIISDMFGSQWPESILKVPGRTGDSAQYVYGVDTVAKKIWRTDGNTFECISDFKVQEFLNNNITLGEREITPKIGIRNVKTLYNAYKRDVMFTFYDNTYGFEEKVWNLCWNELLLKFITFYSWVPSYMENINNIPFSFDRNVSKWIAKLGVSHSNSSFADGITLTNVLLNIEDGTYTVDNYNVTISYVTKSGETKTHTESIPTGSRKNLVGALQLNSNTLPNSNMFYNVHFELLPDVFGNYKEFYIPPKEEPIMEVSLPDDALFAGKTIKIYGLYFNDAKAPLDYVYYKDLEGLLYEVKDNKSLNVCVKSNSLCSELYYRNNAGHAYADYDTNRIGGDGNLYFDKPIFKNIEGKRPMLPRNLQINPNKLVSLLNIKATIEILDTDNKHIPDLDDTYYNIKSGYIAGYYESVVAITPKWNLLFLTSDFWKHGLGGIIDIADDIFPTYWYGRQHPFEFEVVVVNDPSIHKIFSNLELVANKAKPESFHYEIIGECYDFAKDKPNMYFRLEARKALWLYNGADICYNRNFLKVLTKLLPKSADLPHRYYSRLDTINDIEDYYYTRTLSDYDVNNSNSLAYSYKHLAGAEIVYYPNRQEFRIWNHVPAVSKDDLLDNTAEYWIKLNGITTYVNDTDRNYTNKDLNKSHRLPYSGGRSIIGANCEYLEDRWRVLINPIIVCYKNEYKREYSGYRLDPDNTTWPWNSTNTSRLPSIPVFNSPVPDIIMLETNGEITYPFKWKENGTLVEDPCTDKNNALYGLYHPSSEEHWDMLDGTNWLNDVNIYKTNFGEAQNRKELDLKDKFMKVRIRYSGEELAVIDFLNTIYRVSYV